MLKVQSLLLLIVLGFLTCWVPSSYASKSMSHQEYSRYGVIESIDRKKKTKITVAGVTYTASRAVKVRLGKKWISLGKLSVKAHIFFTYQNAKHPDQLPKMLSIKVIEG